MLLNSSTISVTMIASIINTMESNSKSLMKLQVQTSWEGPAAREQRFFALAKMQSLRLQAVLPVDCASSLLCTVSWQTPAWYPMHFKDSRYFDGLQQNLWRRRGGSLAQHKGAPRQKLGALLFRQAGRTGAQKLCPGGPYLTHPASCLPPHFLLY